MQTKNKKTNKKKRIPTTVVASLASLSLIIGGFFLFNNYAHSKKIKAYDYMANVFYLESIKENKEVKKENTSDNVESNEEVQEEEKPTVQVDNPVNYIGYLEIPKINLNKGFFDVNDSNNNVEKNIYVSPTSSYPNVKNGNLIIAGHSGTGWKAFFNNLYRLNKDDYVFVTYGSKKYSYKIDRIYKQNKTGKIAIYRDYEKTTLTLVTCTNNDSETQTIYIAYLVLEQDI